MIVIKRDDGVKFIAQVYREPLTVKNKRLLIQELRMLSAQHGQYVCLRRKSRQALEASFSQEPGFLLGELIWDYFGRLNNIIYCEAMSNGAHCLLVVIRHGSVYLANKLSSDQIQKELIPLLADNQVYDIYTYGDVPLRDVETFGGATFTLPKKRVSQFHYLKHPIFPQLLTAQEFELQPLPTALRSRYLRRHDVFAVVAFLFVVVFGSSFWFLATTHSDVNATTAAHFIGSAPYQAALTTPRPVDLLNEVARHIDQLYLIPGWAVSKITYNDGQYAVHMLPKGGDLWYLTQWAKQHYYDFHVTSNGAALQLRSQMPRRVLPKHYASFDKATNVFIHRMEHVLTHRAIHVHESHKHGAMREIRVTLDVEQLSPDLLDLVGQELDDLPISLSAIDLRITDGLIEGKIDLSLWGRS